MTAPALRDIETFHLPLAILEETAEVLRSFGEEYLEGLLLWIGRIEGTEAWIDDLVVPPQTSMSSEDGVGWFLDAEVLFLLNRKLAATGQRLIAQVHSHPGRAYHSSTDDRYAVVTAEGGLSLVVPDFAVGPAVLTRWAVFRLEGTYWRLLHRSEVRALFDVEP